MEQIANGINYGNIKDNNLSTKKVKLWKYNQRKMLKDKMYILAPIMGSNTKNGQ